MKHGSLDERAIYLMILEYGWHNTCNYLLTQAHTFFICMIHAKVKLIWRVAWTGA